ncbi:MAG: hypothetical protein M1816_006410 [Peltula sp. TS41687]|nr:MAG: hypothetical protein M1816_006410 [Peltula sp. TS41687]
MDQVEEEKENGPDRVAVEEDATEAELEKLVFGNDAGFRAGIKSHVRETSQHPYGSDDDDDEDGLEGADGGKGEEGGEALGGLDDSELFFLDAGPAGNQGAIVVHEGGGYREGDLDEDDTEMPAWEDSDDDRMMVSLANNARLRKLRNFEGEDLVNGREYTRRLRRQFVRLNPVPEWVQYARRQESRKKKRRKSLESNESGSSVDEASSGEEMDVDDDDEEEELSAKPLAKLLQNPDALIRTTNRGIGSSSKRIKFRPEVIDIQRTRDVGGLQPSAITSLSFHPTHPMLLTAGPASTLYLHRLSPSDSTNPNPLLTSLHVRRTPITSAFFHPHGSRIFFSGRKSHFHIWDLADGAVEKISRIQGHSEQQRDMERFKLSPCGRWIGLVGSRRKANVGLINILDAQTTQWIAEARVESRGGIADFAWWRDGEGLTAAGKGGEVIEYSLGLRRVLARWFDEGAVGTTVLCLGGRIKPTNTTTAAAAALGPDRYVAVGSTTGIVNVYDRLPWTTTTTAETSIPSRPKPLRTLESLTTPISHLVFSPVEVDAQGHGQSRRQSQGVILALSSRWKRNALRLVHLPSGTVYRNWPTSTTNLGRITAVGFGWGGAGGAGEEGGGGGGEKREKSSAAGLLLYLALGNEQGRCGLWEIRG